MRRLHLVGSKNHGKTTLLVELIEGDLNTHATTIEVWRATLGSPPLALSRSGITAVVTDDPLDIDLPVLPRAEIEGLLDQVLVLAGVREVARARV